MKNGKSVLILLLASTAVCAGSYAQQDPAGDARPVASLARRFSSDLGFQLSYPAAWTYNDLGPALPAAKLALDKESESDPNRRSIECSQNIFSAKFGEPRSNFLAGAITTECMGGMPDLDAFAARTMKSLEGRYRLNEIQYAPYSIQGQTFWVMRTVGSSRNDPADVETIEYVATVLPNALIYVSGRSRSKQAQAGFEHARLRLANGVETELIPTDAFAAGEQRTQSLPAAKVDESTPSAPSLPESAPVAAIPVAPEATKPAIPGDYSAEPMVIEKLEHVYTMAADGTGVRQFTVVARVQSDAAVRQLGVLGLPYASSAEHVELTYVRVRRPDGTVTETPVTEAIEMPAAVTTAAPFYSDLKELQIPVRNLRAGDRLEWQAKFVRTKPEAPGQFWGEETFFTDAVVLSQIVELRVPKDIYVNVWSAETKPVESTTSTEHVYRWESSQLKTTVGKEAEADKEKKNKQLWTAGQEIDEKEGKLPSVAWTTFKNWEAVGAWYRSLEGDRTLPSDAELKAKVVELTTGKTTQEDKVRALYTYVSTQIRYIGIDFGIGRVQPHYATEVLQNQYGDCKDKHTLLAAMLSAIGVHADAVLIGASIRFNEAVPSPQSFNHLITRVSVEGQTVWLDSTPEVAPYRVLSSLIRDKKALIIPDSGVAILDRTPADLPFHAIQKMNAVGTLDNTGTSNSRIDMTLRGDNELILRAAFHQVSPGQYDDLVQRVSQSMGYAGTTSHAEVSRPEDTTDPLKISYDYKREKAGDWDHLKIVPQLTPVDLPRPSEQDPPVHSISLGAPRTEVSTSAMTLPSGWGAELPTAVHVKSRWVTYDETYRFEKGIIYAERKIEVLQEKVSVADWKTYKIFTDEADIGNEKFIQLTASTTKSYFIPPAPAAKLLTESAKSAYDPALTTKSYSIPPAPTAKLLTESPKPPYDPRVAKLIAAARQSIQHHEFEAAQSQLDEARSLNPQQVNLWANYGYLEYQRGNMTAAISDYQKELALYPSNFWPYSPLAEAQSILGQEKEAQETLRNWADAQSDSPAPVIALVFLLLEDGHAAEAAAAAETGMAHLPEMRKHDQYLQMLAGRAQLAAGMKQKGEATLLDLLHTTTSTEMMNDAAYELADAGLDLDLDLDESTTRAALDRFATESKTWTLQENPQNTMAASGLITATWDTLGWILYREGKITEAETYLQPAWVNREDAEVGKHLAEIAEAKGNREDALCLYELALASIPRYLRPANQRTPGTTQKELTQHIETLRKAGVKEPTTNADDALLEIRTISLGPSGGLVGTAEYRLLLGNGEIRDAQKASDKDVPTALEKIKGAKIPSLWPKGSEAQLVRNAILNCHAGICELVFEQ